MSANDDVDVVIVGSGASGGAFAWQLSQMPGLRILCLEQGDWVPKPADVPTTDASGQIERLTAPPQNRLGVRYNHGGYPYDYSQSYWQPILGNAVGGATLHYAAVWARLHPYDFVPATLDGVGENWPITYWDLAPYYDLNDRRVGVSGVPGNPAYPPKSSRLLPPLPLSKSGEVIERGLRALKWHSWPAERAIVTEPFNGRQPCPNRCVNCDTGCPKEAKNSSDVVFWPDAIKNGVVLKTRATVAEILLNKQGLADSVVYFDADGRVQRQKARVVVLAANGIGTPRLLLHSKSSRFPNGLANRSGLVGRGLMGHPKATVVGVFEGGSNGPRQLESASITCDEFCRADPSRGFVRGFWIMSGAFSGPIDAAIGEAPTSIASLVPVALRATATKNTLPWGAAHHAAFQERYFNSVAMSVYADELPEDVNRIELDPTLKDTFGIPAPKLFYRMGSNTEKILQYGMNRCRDVMDAAGVTRIASAGHVAPAPGHYLGTARMGADPGRSVVDKWCRAHDVRNLFIIDGSVFTTSCGGLVPTSTIQALALRTADYVRSKGSGLLV